MQVCNEHCVRENVSVKSHLQRNVLVLNLSYWFSLFKGCNVMSSVLP